MRQIKELLRLSFEVGLKIRPIARSLQIYRRRWAIICDVPRVAGLSPRPLGRKGRAGHRSGAHGRNKAMLKACREGGYTLSAVAQEVGLSAPRVSRIISAWKGMAKGKA